MTKKTSVALTAFLLLGTAGAQAETLRWATGTDPSTMDPYATNSAPVLGSSITSMRGWSAVARI